MGEVLLGCSLVLLILVLLFIRDRKKNNRMRYINYEIYPNIPNSYYINSYQTPIKREVPFYYYNNPYYQSNYKFVNQYNESLNISGNSNIINNSLMKNEKIRQKIGNTSLESIEEETIFNRMNNLNGIKSNLKIKPEFYYQNNYYNYNNNNQNIFKTVKLEDFLKNNNNNFYN